MILFIVCIMVMISIIPSQAEELLEWITILIITACTSVGFYIYFNLKDENN
jgi:hypothetical protein